MVFTALLALSYYAGPSRYSADYLETKITWWWKVAETRRPAVACQDWVQGARDWQSQPGLPAIADVRRYVSCLVAARQ